MKAGLSTDALALVELSAIVDEATSLLRHELRNRLGSIRNASFYVKRRLSKTDSWAEDPRVEEMARLLDNDVIAANALLERPEERLHKRSLAYVDPRQCILRAVEHARIGPSTEFRVDASPGRARCDADELAMAVRCLLENSAEAMGGAGVVEVRARPEGAAYTILVVDQGSGIEDAQREAVLEPFYTTKPGHAGLGLNIARRIAHRYRGKLLLRTREAGPPSVSITLESSEGEAHDDGPPG